MNFHCGIKQVKQAWFDLIKLSNPPPVCYPVDHHQVHDEVGYAIPVTHRDAVRRPQVGLTLKPKHTLKHLMLHI